MVLPLLHDCNSMLCSSVSWEIETSNDLTGYYLKTFMSVLVFLIHCSKIKGKLNELKTEILSQKEIKLNGFEY